MCVLDYALLTVTHRVGLYLSREPIVDAQFASATLDSRLSTFRKNYYLCAMTETSPLNKVRLIDLPKICDPRGNLSFVEGGRHVPFSIQRVFYIYDVPGGETRGGHAHRQCQIVLIAVAGSLSVRLTDGKDELLFHLDRSNRGLLIPPACGRSWRTSPPAPSSSPSPRSGTRRRTISATMTTIAGTRPSSSEYDSVSGYAARQCPVRGRDDRGAAACR